MTTTRDTYHHGDLKRALIEAALEIIREEGPEAFTLRAAARRVGVNHRAAYRHFEDKNALLAAVAEQGYRALTEQLHTALAKTSGDPVDQLVAIARAYVVFAMTHSAHFKVMFGPELSEEQRFPSLTAEVLRSREILWGTLERGRDLGVLRPDVDVDAAICLWSTMHGLASLMLMRRVPVKRSLLEGYAEKVLAPTIRGLLATS